jgi:hypothetical protein
VFFLYLFVSIVLVKILNGVLETSYGYVYSWLSIFMGTFSWGGIKIDISYYTILMMSLFSFSNICIQCYKFFCINALLSFHKLW